MLTDRAQAFLKTLKRGPFLPTRVVEKILHDMGKPCFESWLDFHERYAGYIEPLGHDTAIWGIAHEESHWIGARQVRVKREPRAEIWYVACAEVHPSYEYLLDNTGEFLGAPSVTFDVKVEQNALGWSFFSSGQAVKVSSQDLNNQLYAERLRQKIQPCLIEAASDRYFRYYLSTDYFVIEDAEDSRITEAWCRI